jgi:hypothetical protein
MCFKISRQIPEKKAALNEPMLYQVLHVASCIDFFIIVAGHKVITTGFPKLGLGREAFVFCIDASRTETAFLLGIDW